jgi:hypothetical protein
VLAMCCLCIVMGVWVWVSSVEIGCCVLDLIFIKGQSPATWKCPNKSPRFQITFSGFV